MKALKIRAEIPEAYAGLFDPARYKVYWGGRGAGRSWACARALLIMGSQRRIRWLCTRELQRSIKDSVHQLLKEQIAGLGLPGYLVLEHEIRGANGTWFGFEGLRYNAESIKSYEGLDGAWVEEAEKVSDESWEVLIPTIRRPGSEIWITFNPDQPSDPTYRRFITSPPPGGIVRRTSWRDNPFLPAELARERDYLWRVDPCRAAHVWEGECRTHSDAQVLHGKWVVDAFEPDSSWDGPYYGADWGFARDPTTLIRLWHRPDGALMIDHEAWGVEVGLDETPALFDRVPGCRGHIIRADSARPETIAFMQRRGFDIIGASKWPGSVEDGIMWLRSRPVIVIHPRCRQTIDEAREWSYKRDRLTGDILSKLEDGHEHCWDAVRYALQPLIRTILPWVADGLLEPTGDIGA